MLVFIFFNVIPYSMGKSAADGFILIKNEKQMLFQDKVKQNKDSFLKKVKEISEKLNINPDWLMFLMYNESGLDSTVVNKMGGATGLIQFMPATAKGLCTTTEQLRAMSNVEQLDYVYKYFAPYKNRITSAYDLYSICFMPIILGKPDSWVLKTKNLSAETIARYNPAFDLNKDKQITVAEWKKYLDVKFAKYGVNPFEL